MLGGVNEVILLNVGETNESSESHKAILEPTDSGAFEESSIASTIIKYDQRKPVHIIGSYGIGWYV